MHIILPWIYPEPNVPDLRLMVTVTKSTNDFEGLLLKLKTRTFICNSQKENYRKINKILAEGHIVVIFILQK